MRGSVWAGQWTCWRKPAPGQAMAHLGRPGCHESRHPVMGHRAEGKDPAPDPAAESEKLIIARRPEMHPMVIEPSGTSPLGKEAMTSLPGRAVQTWGVAGQCQQLLPNGPWSWTLGRALISRPESRPVLIFQGKGENIQDHVLWPQVCERLNFP